MSELTTLLQRKGICRSCGNKDGCPNANPRVCCCSRWKAMAGVRA